MLRERGLLTPGVAAELAAGRRYWGDEARLCSLMLAHPAVPPDGHGATCGFSLEQVLAASEAKSFDYRLCHHLLYALTQRQPDAALLAFLRADELLVDIGEEGLKGGGAGQGAAWPDCRAQQCQGCSRDLALCSRAAMPVRPSPCAVPPHRR